MSRRHTPDDINTPAPMDAAQAEEDLGAARYRYHEAVELAVTARTYAEITPWWRGLRRFRASRFATRRWAEALDRHRWLLVAEARWRAIQARAAAGREPTEDALQDVREYVRAAWAADAAYRICDRAAELPAWRAWMRPRFRKRAELMFEKVPAAAYHAEMRRLFRAGA